VTDQSAPRPTSCWSGPSARVKSGLRSRRCRPSSSPRC
jgi:hypothetical protein